MQGEQDEFEAEADAALGGGNGTESGGGQTPWNRDDPLIPESNLFQAIAYNVRMVPTIGRVMYLYGLGDLKSNHTVAMDSNMSMRILKPVQIPDEFRAKLPLAQRLLTFVRDESDSRRYPEETDFSQEEFGEPDIDMYPPLPDGKQMTRVPQRMFKFSGVKMESTGRKETGMYFMSATAVEGWTQLFLALQGLDVLDLTEDQVEQLPQESLDRAILALHFAREKAAVDYYPHHKGWSLVCSGGRKVEFNSMERWNHRLHALGLQERVSVDEVGRPLGPFTNTQTHRDSVSAYLELERLGSTILDEPRYTYKKNDKKVLVATCVYQGDQVVVSAYELRKLDKTTTWRKSFLTYRGAVALALVKDDYPKQLRDDWYFGSIPDLPVSDYLFLRGRLHRKLCLGPLSRLPDTFRLPDGPRLAGYLAKLGIRVPKSYEGIEDTIGRIGNGEVIRRDEQWKKHRFANWDKEQMFWAYVERNRKGIRTVDQHIAAGSPDGWELHAVPRRAWALYMNTLWMIRNESLILPQLAEHVVENAAGVGIDIRITYDSPDCNFFKTRETWLEVWRKQPYQNIKDKLMSEVIEPAVKSGQWLDLRSDIVKFFVGLPVDRIVGQEEIEPGQFWPKMDLMDLFDDTLKLADDLAIAQLIWTTSDEHMRITDQGDGKRLLGGGYGIHYTERLAKRYPGILRGRVDKPDKQFSPFTFQGMQKNRLTVLYFIYDVDFVVGSMKGLIEKLLVGIQPTVDEVHDEIMSNLGSRKLYLVRVLNVLDYMEDYFEGKLMRISKKWGIDVAKDKMFGDVVARRAFKLMRAAVHRAIKLGDDSPSKKLDLFADLVLRNHLGEVEGHGGWVDAIQGGRFVEEIREKLVSVS